MRLTTTFAAAGFAACLVSLASTAPAFAQSSNSACLGQLMLFGGMYCPQGYVEAAGETLPIAQYSALYSLYGTTYGGNGTQTFGVPDLRGRAPVGQGQGPNLPNYTQGQMAGAPQVTMTVDQMPAHSHSANANQGPSGPSDPSGTALASASIYTTKTPNVAMSSQTIGLTGGGKPLTTQSPIQVLRWCVAVSGIYCPRP